MIVSPSDPLPRTTSSNDEHDVYLLKRFLAIRIDEILSLLTFLSVNKIILHNQLEKITYVTPLPGTIKVVTQLMHQYFIDKKCK